MVGARVTLNISMRHTTSTSVRRGSSRCVVGTSAVIPPLDSKLESTTKCPIGRPRSLLYARVPGVKQFTPQFPSEMSALGAKAVPPPRAPVIHLTACRRQAGSVGAQRLTIREQDHGKRDKNYKILLFGAKKKIREAPCFRIS